MKRAILVLVVALSASSAAASGSMGQDSVLGEHRSVHANASLCAAESNLQKVLMSDDSGSDSNGSGASDAQEAI